jgi:hypothetical protein
MAQIAVESGQPGVDYQTIHELYTELGLPKPAQFPAKTFSNAKASGLVKLVKPGVWKPTYRGENFARGLGRAERGNRRGSGRSKASQRDEGGESD